MIELTQEYLTSEAEEKAKNFARNDLDSSQLRKFYNDFKLLERKIQHKSERDFEKEILPLIKFVKSKIAYSAGREVSGRRGKKTLVPPEFKEHMDKQIDSIKTEKDFKNFLLHYQAIIGFYTYIQTYEKQERHQSRGGRR